MEAYTLPTKRDIEQLANRRVNGRYKWQITAIWMFYIISIGSLVSPPWPIAAHISRLWFSVWLLVPLLISLILWRLAWQRESKAIRKEWEEHPGLSIKALGRDYCSSTDFAIIKVLLQIIAFVLFVLLKRKPEHRIKVAMIILGRG
jgi:hypothetical protein